MTISRVAVVGGLRIPFVKSFTHYANVSNFDMLTFVMQALVKKYRLENRRLGEVTLGAVMNHSSDWNLGREIALES